MSWARGQKAGFGEPGRWTSKGGVLGSANAWVSREHANAIVAGEGGELEPAGLPESDRIQVRVFLNGNNDLLARMRQ